jgi:type II secretory pathway pseudopilin PulG
MSRFLTSWRGRLLEERGFTMLATIGVMFVTSMLLAAGFIVARGDSHLSLRDTNSKQAYYAALAGIQQYEYELQANPDYWQTCKTPSGKLPEESNESYEIALLPAKGATECSTASPFSSMIETSGAVANTFRIKSTGKAGTATRSVVATFEVAGFLDYIYFTNYEQGDPKIFESGSEVANCEKKYYSAWSGKYKCTSIEFASGDSVNGPMHTNDSADVGGSATFGREGHVPSDSVEINGGTYPQSSCKEMSAKFYTASGCYSKGITMEPPENDTSLSFYVEGENEFEGVTYLELKGSEGTEGKIAVKWWNSKGEEQNKTINWPQNGLIYVKESANVACKYEFSLATADEETERKNEKGCGTVYVKGTYRKSLTIAGEQELVINGEIYPTNVASTLGSAPSGTATLGLIASKYVRVYHECSGGRNGTSLENPWIYAAILSTQHSFIVDHYDCGALLGKLHVYGAIAQNYRGAVGTGSGTPSTGYLKNYNYDDRLANILPPYLFDISDSGWHISRETLCTAGSTSTGTGCLSATG